jgi:hypothetical protein
MHRSRREALVDTLQCRNVYDLTCFDLNNASLLPFPGHLEARKPRSMASDIVPDWLQSPQRIWAALIDRGRIALIAPVRPKVDSSPKLQG